MSDELLFKFDGWGLKFEAFITAIYLYYKLGPSGAKKYLARHIRKQEKSRKELLKEQRDLLRRERDLLKEYEKQKVVWSGKLINGNGGQDAKM